MFWEWWNWDVQTFILFVTNNWGTSPLIACLFIPSRIFFFFYMVPGWSTWTKAKKPQKEREFSTNSTQPLSFYLEWKQSSGPQKPESNPLVQCIQIHGCSENHLVLVGDIRYFINKMRIIMTVYIHKTCSHCCFLLWMPEIIWMCT